MPKPNITNLRTIAERIRPLAEACEKVPAGADGQGWFAIPGGTLVRVSDLRATAKAYRDLRNMITEARTMTTKHRTRKDEWTVLRLEKEEASPGYRWLVHNPNLGEGDHYFGTKTEALAFVRKQQGGTQ